VHIHGLNGTWFGPDSGITRKLYNPLESDAPESSISDSAPEDTKIADLLASLQMHHFKERIKAPEFELTSINGKKVSLSQYHGDVVLLSFWATW